MEELDLTPPEFLVRVVTPELKVKLLKDLEQIRNPQKRVWIKPDWTTPSVNTAEKRAETRRGKVIRILVQGNPKKKGSKGFQKFALLKDGMTLEEYRIAAKEVTGNDGWCSGEIAYCLNKNFIKIEEVGNDTN